MIELIKMIGDYGVLMVIAGVFIWTTVSDRINMKKNDKDAKERDAKYNESLSLLSESNQNIAKALELLRQSIDNNDTLLRQHDERAIKMKEEMTEVRLLVSNCSNKK